MAEQEILKATARTATGKGVARRLRGKEMLPAVVYGHKTAAIPLAIKLKNLQNLLGSGKSERKIFLLSIEGNGEPAEKTVMIKEIQVDPVNRCFLHVDFFEVAMDEEVTLSLPIRLTGTPAGVLVGGVLQQVKRELSIRCLPSQIPDSLEADVSSLAIGDSVHLKDMQLPPGIKIFDDLNTTIATMLAPTIEKEVAKEAAPEAEAAGAAKATEEKKSAEEKEKKPEKEEGGKK
jgi:large subunit ribosomal protein L25